MKKVLFCLLAVVAVALVGCSKDDNEPNENIENKAPVIESVVFGNDDNTIFYNRNTFGLNQKVIVRVNVNDPENDKVSLSWSSGTNNFGNGKELELTFGKVNPNAEVTVKATDEKGNSSSFTKTFSVVDCDFGFGLWGDGINIIKESETGVYNGNNASVIYEFIEEGRRFYTFSDNKFVSGTKRNEYTPKVLQPAQFEIAWTLYEETLNKLIEKYGNYTKQETSTTFSGTKKDKGLALINGANVDTYFSNEKTNVHYKVYHSTTSATTVIYDVIYSKR